MLTFREWLNIFDSTRDEPEAENIFFGQIRKHAKTFEDWRNIFYRCRSGSKDEMEALVKMASLSVRFGNWMNVFQEAPGGSEIRKQAMFWMMIRSEDPKDADWDGCRRDRLRLTRWQKILVVAELGSKAEKIASRRVIDLTQERKQEEIIARRKVPAVPIKL